MSGKSDQDWDAEILLYRRALKEALAGWRQWLINYPDKEEQERFDRLERILRER